MTKTNKEQHFYTKYKKMIIHFYSKGMYDEISDTMLHLQNELIEKGYLNKNLVRTNLVINNKVIEELLSAFEIVRIEFAESNGELLDYDYIGVAIEWLNLQKSNTNNKRLEIKLMNGSKQKVEKWVIKNQPNYEYPILITEHATDGFIAYLEIK